MRIQVIMSFNFFQKKQEPFKEKKIGILRTLYYFYYPEIWETFFSLIGCEPVMSEPTSRKTIEEAGKISEPEHCLPVKMFDAHLADLKDKADMIFVPRMLSSIKEHISCPKLGALPDVAAVSP